MIEMAELLANYSISEILIFVIAIALALKGIVEFIDWIKERGKKYFDKETTSVEQIKKLEEKNAEQDEKITQILDSQNKIQENMDIIIKQIQILIQRSVKHVLLIATQTTRRVARIENHLAK